MILADEGLAELHTHLGGSVASEILWSIAHEQGIALPVKDFWEFDALVTVSDAHGGRAYELDQIYHWTELIQSSPLAVERSVHGAIGGAYRSQRITTLELRFNPMKRNRAASATSTTSSSPRSEGRPREHRVPAGARRPDPDDGSHVRPATNEIIVDKAIRWSGRGVVGVDIAGPRREASATTTRSSSR